MLVGNLRLRPGAACGWWVVNYVPIASVYSFSVLYFALIYSCQCLMFLLYMHSVLCSEYIAHEHCVTHKCFVRPHYLSSPQAPRTAGFGRPNARQGITKCRAPDFTNKCRHPFGVQTAWAQHTEKQHCDLNVIVQNWCGKSPCQCSSLTVIV